MVLLLVGLYGSAGDGWARMRLGLGGGGERAMVLWSVDGGRWYRGPGDGAGLALWACKKWR